MSIATYWPEWPAGEEVPEPTTTALSRALDAARSTPSEEARDARVDAVTQLAWWADQAFAYGRLGPARNVRVLSDVIWAARRLLIEEVRDWQADGLASWADIGKAGRVAPGIARRRLGRETW